jgi:hypothetical protein
MFFFGFGLGMRTDDLTLSSLSLCEIVTGSILPVFADERSSLIKDDINVYSSQMSFTLRIIVLLAGRRYYSTVCHRTGLKLQK